MLILCGVVGSGKSTFAVALQHHCPSFVRLSQDELGSREAVDIAAQDVISRGYSVIIDRTNFNISQRRTWIEIAQECGVGQVWGIVFDTPYEVCVERLETRLHHPTLRQQNAIAVLQRFWGGFVMPTKLEGFDQLITLPPQELPTYSPEDMTRILNLFKD